MLSCNRPNLHITAVYDREQFCSHRALISSTILQLGIYVTKNINIYAVRRSSCHLAGFFADPVRRHRGVRRIFPVDAIGNAANLHEIVPFDESCSPCRQVENEQQKADPHQNPRHFFMCFFIWCSLLLILQKARQFHTETAVLFWGQILVLVCFDILILQVRQPKANNNAVTIYVSLFKAPQSILKCRCQSSSAAVNQRNTDFLWRVMWFIRSDHLQRREPLRKPHPPYLPWFCRVYSRRGYSLFFCFCQNLSKKRSPNRSKMRWLYRFLLIKWLHSALQCTICLWPQNRSQA